MPSPAQPMKLFKDEGWLPGDAVAMDVATLPWGDGKFRYFLLMVDMFSHYIELAPLEDQTAESIVKTNLKRLGSIAVMGYQEYC